MAIALAAITVEKLDRGREGLTYAHRSPEEDRCFREVSALAVRERDMIEQIRRRAAPLLPPAAVPDPTLRG